MLGQSLDMMHFFQRIESKQHHVMPIEWIKVTDLSVFSQVFMLIILWIILDQAQSFNTGNLKNLLEKYFKQPNLKVNLFWIMHFTWVSFSHLKKKIVLSNKTVVGCYTGIYIKTLMVLVGSNITLFSNKNICTSQTWSSTLFTDDKSFFILSRN